MLEKGNLGESLSRVDSPHAPSNSGNGQCCEICLRSSLVASPQPFVVCHPHHRCPCLQPCLVLSHTSSSFKALFIHIIPLNSRSFHGFPHPRRPDFIRGPCEPALPPWSGYTQSPAFPVMGVSGREGVMSGDLSNQRGCVHRRAGAPWWGRTSESQSMRAAKFLSGKSGQSEG